MTEAAVGVDGIANSTRDSVTNLGQLQGGSEELSHSALQVAQLTQECFAESDKVVASVKAVNKV
ncbi:MAG: hypothetical protein SCK28_02995 [Bacillota bacterium]|nr:hypothetical protein [Bacillota bacterium]